ncbi:uncharacterized protein LOC130713198 [Lotus japonicus]|uniref:uncharacterized protein LOC130713198 n=1 Tax=Lotus japonicus TaxID=34305 RepID=UPI00258CF00B|nr:uncharacterized protein LOC130713198 [Lotus japonicus]
MAITRKSKAVVEASSQPTQDGLQKQKLEEAQKILATENVVTCTKRFDELVVYHESRVDFESLAAHGFDIRAQVEKQGWSSYFERLNGPVYSKLVVEFWKHAVCNDYYVVSHVLNRKIIISEESIAKLLGMEFQQGRRIKNVEANLPGMRSVVNKVIYNNWSLEKTKYNIKDLKSEMKIWQKIFIYCIHPRTGGTDYLNATQKVIMEHISNYKPVCLPFLLFNYLKDCVKKSRTIASDNKRLISYIPYGRLLSDIFTQNQLVKTLTELNLHDDLTMTIGDSLNATKLKKMQIVKTIKKEPMEDTSEQVRQRNYPVDDFPLWSKKDNPESIMEYVRMLRSEGDTITFDEFVEKLPDSSPDLSARYSRKATSSKTSDPKGKGILIEESKRKRVASKSVVIREPIPEASPSPEISPERIAEESSTTSDSESTEDSMEEFMNEETENGNVPVAKRIKVVFDEESEQDIRESYALEQTSEIASDARRERRSKHASDPARDLTSSTSLRNNAKVTTKSTNLDSALVIMPDQPIPLSTSMPTQTQTAPTKSHSQPQTQATTVPVFNSFIQGIAQNEATLKKLVDQFSTKPLSTSETIILTLTGEVPTEEEAIEEDDVQILRPPYDVQPLRQVASNIEDQIPDAVGESSTSRQSQVPLSEHLDETVQSEAEMPLVNASEQQIAGSSSTSGPDAVNPEPTLTLATSVRPQDLMQLIKEFSEEATRRLQWLYQVTDNQLNASFVENLWTAFEYWSEEQALEFQRLLGTEKRLRVHDANARAHEQRVRLLRMVCEPIRRAMAERAPIVSERTSEDAEMASAEVAEDGSEGIVILEESDENVVEKPVQTKETEVPTSDQTSEVPTSEPISEPSPLPDAAAIAARLNRLEENQQRMVQIVEQQGITQTEQGQRIESLMKLLLEKLH